MKQISLKLLVAHLENDLGLSANRELARRVSNNSPDAVDFYISKLGKDIVEYIANII